ncbi:hypothetical protein COO60DRAFT_958972 [Scenedesmus sp. NREL 46B-D3]|nr:hypothetical protein COO60DRAFT_958972 [Scenedesmus sp. NREL 46B-D3]
MPQPAMHMRCCWPSNAWAALFVWQTRLAALSWQACKQLAMCTSTASTAAGNTRRAAAAAAAAAAARRVAAEWTFGCNEQFRHWGAAAAASSPLHAVLLCAELQLVVRAVFLFLQHGRWAQPQAGAGLSGSSSGSRWEQARQVAAEQCFRHVSLLVLHITNSAKQELVVVAAADQTDSAAASSQLAAAAAQQQHEASAAVEAGAAGTVTHVLSIASVQVCVQELCCLAAALSGCVDCSALQVLLLLLQLLQQLLGGAHSRSAVSAGSASASAVEGLLPRPPLPAGPDVATMQAVAHSASSAAEQAVPTTQQQEAVQSVAVGDAAGARFAHGAAALSKDDDLQADSAGAEAPPVLPGWQDQCMFAGVPCGQLLSWVGRQLQLLPRQMQQLLVPAAGHMAEQQLAGLLGRSLTEEEVEEVENVARIA